MNMREKQLKTINNLLELVDEDGDILSSERNRTLMVKGLQALRSEYLATITFDQI